jgi:hypothetical protein
VSAPVEVDGQPHIQLVHDLGEVIASLGGLAEGEALGIEIGHVACFAA